jgi:hypothetical protein
LRPLFLLRAPCSCKKKKTPKKHHDPNTDGSVQEEEGDNEEDKEYDMMTDLMNVTMELEENRMLRLVLQPIDDENQHSAGEEDWLPANMHDTSQLLETYHQEQQQKQNRRMVLMILSTI